MNLEDFENDIDHKILTRGRNYFEDGRVLRAEEIRRNVYLAKVDGTKLYSVKVELDDDGDIIDTVCNCPYDMGEYCKHQAAVLFMLREERNGSSCEDEDDFTDAESSAAVTSRSVRKIRKTPAIREILASRSKNELIELLEDLANENDDIRWRIGLNFFEGSDEDEIDESAQFIQASIGQYSDCNGFVDYDDVFEASKGADFVLNKTHAAIEEKRYVQAVNLALCVVREMDELLESADDSDGFIGMKIGEALQLIGDVAKSEGLDSADRERIFSTLIEEAESGRSSDWDFEILECCSDIANTQAMRDTCEKLLQWTGGGEDVVTSHGSYMQERAGLIRYKMIKRLDGEEKARAYIDKNLRLPEFRAMAIKNAMAEQDYASVERMALDGERADHDFRGLVQRWKEYRYTAYQKSGNREKQRAIALEFIYDGSFEYYMELKATYRANEWRPVASQIISKLEDQKKTAFPIYTSILVEESENEKLLIYVRRNLPEIEKYYELLVPGFKEEVFDIFLRHIVQTAAKASSRGEYQHICAIIRKLKKAGGKEQAVQIKQELLKNYPRKPAFKDELSRV